MLRRFLCPGGCVAVLTQTDHSKIAKFLASRDLISKTEQTRTKLLERAINNRGFQALNRRFRQELLSMDGATVLTSAGKILASGAIVKVPSGSTGGGRTAAAKQLSKLGIGIKISADGPITGIKKGKTIFLL